MMDFSHAFEVQGRFGNEMPTSSRFLPSLRPRLLSGLGRLLRLVVLKYLLGGMRDTVMKLDCTD